MVRLARPLRTLPRLHSGVHRYPLHLRGVNVTNVPEQIPLALTPTAFEQWAGTRGYDLAPAVLPAPHRIYADRQTQEAFEAWTAGREGRPNFRKLHRRD